ncbi:MAG: metallophosphoesterase [Clostridia bacterium]
MKKMIQAVLIVICIIICINIYISNNIIEVTKYNLESEKIPKEFDGYKIVQISDLHSEEKGKKNIKLIEKIDAQNPDIVVMTGDMVDKRAKDFTTFIDLCNNLAEKYPVYYVVGNNEEHLKVKNFTKLKKELKNTKVKYMSNSKVELKKGESYINLYGIQYKFNLKALTFKPLEKQQKILNVTLGYADKSKYNILLAHDPIPFKNYAAWGADATLSGHIHGGIIRIGTQGVLSPERTFKPKYTGGIYSLEEDPEKKLILNRGLSITPLLFRINNKLDVTCITLKAKEM